MNQRPQSDARKVGDRMRSLREQNSGLNQRQVAAALGVHEATISKWENGQLPVTGELIRYARVIGVAPSRIFDTISEGEEPDLAQLVSDAAARLHEIQKLLDQPDLGSDDA